MNGLRGSQRARMLAAMTVAALAMLVSACLFAPGKFVSTLDVREDRDFTFRYSGEIYLLPLMESEKKAAFEPETCRDDETYDERPCRSDELAQQKKSWEERQTAKRKSNAQAAQYLFGGIDPGDPAAAREFAERLKRQAGWSRVDYLGNGRFLVDYAITGKLDHDFTFPTVERFAMANAFVQISLREDGSVRIDAPGFGPAGVGGGAAGMMSGLGGLASMDGKEAPNPVDGSFVIRTDGSILANNTDQGATAMETSGGMGLRWSVTPRTQAAPMALIQLAPL